MNQKCCVVVEGVGPPVRLQLGDLSADWQPVMRSSPSSHDPTERPTVPPATAIELLAGFVLGAFGVGLLALIGFALLAPPGKPTSTYVLGIAAFGLIGYFCTHTAYRLIFRRGRSSDGGLFSPTFLRVSGVFFAVAPIVCVLVAPWNWLNLIPVLGAAAGCFALARHREEHLRNRNPLTSHDRFPEL